MQLFITFGPQGYKKHPKLTQNGPKWAPKSTQKGNKKLNEKMIEKACQKAPNKVPEEGKTKPLFECFSPLGHPWGPKWSQDTSRELLGLPEPRFFMILG